MTARIVLLLLAALVTAASPAEAKRYSADRFDSAIEVLEDGSIRVTETVVFRFDGGPFKEVYREIPTGRTDGIEIERVTMDGVEFPRGSSPGQVEIDGRQRIRVKWHFTPRSDVTHTFGITYLVRGAVRQEPDADALVFTAIPTKHRYPIAASAIDVLLPVEPSAAPVVNARRTGRSAVRVEGTRVRVDAESLRQNGHLTVTVKLPRGTVLDGPPAWQARQARQRELAPQWILAGIVALAVSLILVFAVHQRYDAPKIDRTLAVTGPALPDSLSPAEAGAVVSNGGVRFEHAMATLLDLARRGEISVVEGNKGVFGQRNFTVKRRAARQPGTPYEEALIDAIFNHKGRAEDAVSLDKARSRATMKIKAFKQRVEAALRAQGLLDESRQRVRNQFARLAVTLIIVAAVLPIPLLLLFERQYGGYPLFIALGLLVGGFVSLIAHASHTPLSDEGLRRSRYWRGLREYLKDVTQNEATPPADAYDRLLPYAVALQQAGRWSRHLKERRIDAPAWFTPASAGDSSPAFIAFIAAGGSHAGGGTGAAGGAAGGGASGAG